MTDDLRDIESELESLRPVEPSPGLRWTIANRLEGGDGGRRWRRLVIAWGSAMAAAACLVAAVLLWQTGHLRFGAHVTVVDVRPATAPTAVVPPPARPTLGVYAGTLARSPDALDQLLDRQAASVRAPAGSPRPWGVTPDVIH
jgi:hypothetical protein